MNALRTAFGIGLAAAALAVPAAAQAAPTSDGFAVDVASQTHDLGSVHVGDSHHFEFAHVYYDLHVSSQAKWTGTLPITTSWNTTDVRQGATLSVARMAPMLQTGKLRVSWTVTGDVTANFIDITVNRTMTVDASCAPQLLSSTYECTASSPGMTLMRMSGMPAGPYVKLRVTTKFNVTPEGAIVSRSLTTAGMPAVTKSGLPVTPVPVIDTVKVPCALSGSPAAYKLGPLHWTPAVTATLQPRIEMGSLDPVIGQAELPAYSDRPLGTPLISYPAFDLTASGHTTQLGSLLANNVKPTIAPMSFSAQAGVAKQLTADTTSRCELDSAKWTFSDGSVAYGENPIKTFSKPGNVTGQLKVTDSSGLSATRDFSVAVSA